jgi:hypothetical protein
MYAEPAEREFRRQELRRLQVLEGLGLAEKVWTRTWRLSPQLETTLRQAQISGDIIKARARHQARLSDPHVPVAVTEIEPGTVITGRVVGTGLADELRDKRYLLLETLDRLHYIPQPAAVQRARGLGQLHIGDIVTLRGEGIAKGGPVMVETHVRALQPVHVPAAGTGHDPLASPNPRGCRRSQVFRAARAARSTSPSRSPARYTKGASWATRVIARAIGMPLWTRVASSLPSARTIPPPRRVAT